MVILAAASLIGGLGPFIVGLGQTYMALENAQEPA